MKRLIQPEKVEKRDLINYIYFLEERGDRSSATMAFSRTSLSEFAKAIHHDALKVSECLLNPDNMENYGDDLEL